MDYLVTRKWHSSSATNKPWQLTVEKHSIGPSFGITRSHDYVTRLRNTTTWFALQPESLDKSFNSKLSVWMVDEQYLLSALVLHLTLTSLISCMTQTDLTWLWLWRTFVWKKNRFLWCPCSCVSILAFECEDETSNFSISFKKSFNFLTTSSANSIEATKKRIAKEWFKHHSPLPNITWMS